MKRFIMLSLLIPCLTFAQSIEIISVAHSVISGYSAYYQAKDRQFHRAGNEVLVQRYNSAWHTSQGLELGLSIGLGGASVYKNQDNIIGYAKDLLLFSAIRWVVRDGVYNSLQGESWFNQSKNTTAMLEPLGTWYVKIGYLIVAIIIYYMEL